MIREHSLYDLAPLLSFSHLVVPDFAVHQASLSLTISWNLPKFISITLVMPSSHLILCHPLFLLPSIFPSIRVFSNESALHIRWPKYWSFNFSISSSNDYSGLVSFRIDWFDLAVQGTLKSLLQHHSLKALVLWCSAKRPLVLQNVSWLSQCWGQDVLVSSFLHPFPSGQGQNVSLWAEQILLSLTLKQRGRVP